MPTRATGSGDIWQSGLTDLVDRPSKSSSDLEGRELRHGREAFLAKLQACRPAVACYNGLGVYRALTGRKDIAYGLQPTQTVEGVLDFVTASPSGRSREPLERKRGLYREPNTLICR